MSSGKYSAISGAVGRMENMNRISEKLAAVKTPGFKQGMSTFAAKLGEANSGMATRATNYTRITGAEIDFSQGSLEYSGAPLDLAINGEGFFQIRVPDGTVGFTRKGHFQLDGESRLIDTNGFAVLDVAGNEIFLPHSDVQINGNGEIWADGAEVARLAVMRFEDNSILQRSRGELFVPRDETQPELTTAAPVVQKNLEGANVDMMKTMAEMTANLRAFEATQKALKIYSDMDSKASDIGQLQ